MERLIRSEMLFGGLMPVSRPHMIERYNSALERFGTRRTKLDAFSIDATGFSPEIAAELGDPHYLDPHGVNRRFIILTPDQGRLPVTQLNFSSTGELVREFFARNMDALKVLTLKDVVYGEIEDSTYRVDDLDDILSIKTLEFQVKTVNGLLEKAGELTALIERFQTDPQAWRDDAMLKRIAELAEACGDTRDMDPVPRHVRFGQSSFWTRHFGGLYIFHEPDEAPVVVGWPREPDFGDQASTMSRYLSLEDADAVFDFLMETGRLEPINFEWLTRSRILEHREDIYIRSAVARLEPTLEVASLNLAWIKNWVTDRYDELAGDGLFPALLKLRKLVDARRPLPRELASAQVKFLMVRATPDHHEQWLVNRLVSEFVPFDFLMRFIYNKEAFYKDYEAFDDALKEYVVHTITTRYFPDKSSLRERLFQ